MGKGYSKLTEVYPQLQIEAGNIHTDLKRHRTHIESVTHTVNTQHAHVQLLLQNMCELEKINDKTASANIEGAEFATSCLNFTRKWQRNTERLLSSVQLSLERQCESLLTSYKSLNKDILSIFDKYSISVGSPKETNVDLCAHAPEYDKCIQNAYGIRKPFESEVDKLEKEKQNLSEELRKTKHENKEILDLKTETENELDKCQQKNETLSEQIKVLHERVAELETKNLSMKNTTDELQTDKEVLERLVRELKEHQPVSIQLFYQVKGDMTSKMIDELKSMLATQMEVKRNELQFIVCQNELDVNPDIPLLVFCISASRLGTDVSTVLQNLKVSSKVSVLVFHHKDIHALPNQSSERVLTGPGFDTLGGIFDIAFLSEKGIYPCDMNHAAAAGIESFLRTQS